MASRVLRKLQREQEEQKRLASLHTGENGLDNDDENEEDEEDDDELPVAKNPKQKGNAFAFLDEAAGEDGGEEDSVAELSDEDAVDEAAASHSNSANQNKSKKKAKKKKKKKPTQSDNAGPNAQANAPQASEGLDEIDLALKSLQVKNGQNAQAAEPATVSDEMKSFYGVLATDSRNLNALNEMKKLFGSSVLEGEAEGGPAPARRRGRGPQQVDLGGALAGRNNPASRGQGLAGLALRKNVFMLGKEEWPKATSGGLGMEVEEKAWDLTTEYRYVHNSAYQDVQKQFEDCVESMDPQRMIRLLQFNPYHISTILQVSEIAKQQGDHSVSGDLLERALFTFGRSVHSSFHTALAEGKARLDFRRPENREFWLAAWRYIGTLGQRGTWRTAYEWAKLLLSLDPEEDPYSVRMIIDQFAIRGGQFESFLQLASTDPTSVIDWGQRSPNIEISSALAHYKLKHAVECRSVLDSAIRRYPWIFARLLRELNIDHIPKSIWGKEPRNDREELETAAYITRAKDIWNTPEALSLLVEVAEIASGPSLVSPLEEEPITLNMARHILLSDIPPLISLLPRSYTMVRTSASDPLPPEDNLPSYSTDPTGLDIIEVIDDMSEDSESETGNRRSFFSNINDTLRRFGLPLYSTSEPAQRAPAGADNVPINDRNPMVESEDEDEDHIDEVEALGGSNLQGRIFNIYLERMRRDGDDSQVDPERLAAERATLAEGNQAHEARWHENPAAAASWDAHVASQNRLLAEQWVSPTMDEVDAYNRWEAINGPIIPTAPASIGSPAGGSSEQPSAATPLPSSSPASPPLPPGPASDDDDATQRWLLGRGLQALKAWTAEQEQDGTELHAETSSTPSSSDTMAEPLRLYVERVRGLKDRQKRNFVLEYGLPQGGGAEVQGLVKRALERG